MAELKLTRSGATPKLFISFKVFCTPGFGKRAKRMGQSDGLSKLRWFLSWIHVSLENLMQLCETSNPYQPSTSPTEAWTAMSALHLPRLSRYESCAMKSWANEKNFTKPGCSPDIKGDFSPSKRTGGFSRGYSLPFVCDGHPPRHTTSVGRMPNCCIFWKWAWRAGWKNLSFGFLSVDFFLLKFHQRSFQFVVFPNPISFHPIKP